MIKFKHPWTNGMVERFNGKIKDKIFRRHILSDRNNLETKLIEYLDYYNLEVRLKQISYQTLTDFLKSNFNKSIQPVVFYILSIFPQPASLQPAFGNFSRDLSWDLAVFFHRR